MAQATEREPDTITVSMDAELKKSFKVKCAIDGVRMTDVIISYINDYVNQKQRRRA